MNRDIGSRIRKIRLRYGMSQQQLAEILGKSRAVVIAYEEGQKIPDYSVVTDISKLFNVSLAYLMGFEGDHAKQDFDIDPEEIKNYNVTEEQVLAIQARDNETNNAIFSEIYNMMYPDYDTSEFENEDETECEEDCDDEKLK